MGDEKRPGLFQRFRAAATAYRNAGTWKPQSIQDLDAEMDAGGGDYSNSGSFVSDSTVLNFSAVYCAVGHISSQLASMPLQVYRRLDDDNRELAKDHPVYRLIHTRPNAEMNSFTWRETGVSHDLLQGNSYNHIRRDRRDRIVDLWPLNPLVTTPERKAGRIQFRFEPPGKKPTYLDAEDVLHIPGLGFDGRKGYSVVSVARESLGMGLAAQEYAARWYGQGMRLGGFLRHPGSLGEKAQTALGQEMMKKTGLQNSHKWIVLEEGMEATPYPTMSAEDAGFLMMLDGGVKEVCRWFKIPPHKLYELSRSTNNNIEQQALEYIQDAVMPWAVRWEQALNCKLLDDGEEYYAEFNLAAALRADMVAQAQALEIERRNGIISTDDWLRLKNRNAIGGDIGDLRIIPANMANIRAVASQTELVEQPQRTPEPSNQILFEKTADGGYSAFSDGCLAAGETLEETARLLEESFDLKKTEALNGRNGH